MATALWKPTHAQADNGIARPGVNATLADVVEVTGSANHATFRKWQLDLLIDRDPNQAAFLAVSEEQPLGRVSLATVDTRLYPNGNHALRLRVVHSNLNYDEYVTPIIIRNAGRSATIDAVTAAEAPKETAEVEPAAKPRAPVSSPKANNRQFTPPEDGRWIQIDISAQTLTAWEGDRIFMQTQISSGRAETPTVAGVFSVERKVDSQRMVGPGYNLPNVTSVMYFFLNYAIHAAYWHDDFGNVASHGCVNMRVDEAAALYGWAEIGTPVYVHD